MYKIHVFDKFHTLCNCCYDNWGGVFSPFPKQPVLQRQILSTQLRHLSILAIPENMESNR